MWETWHLVWCQNLGKVGTILGFALLVQIGDYLGLCEDRIYIEGPSQKVGTDRVRLLETAKCLCALMGFKTHVGGPKRLCE